MTNLAHVKSQYDLWWEHRNDQPIYYIIYPTQQQVSFASVAKPWMSPAVYGQWSNWQQEYVFGHAVELTYKTGDTQYLADALDFLAYYHCVTGHAGEGYSFLQPTLGPGCLAAFITNFTKFNGTTIWLEQEQPLDWGALLQLAPVAGGPYTDVALQAIRMLVARLQDRFMIGYPDLGSPMDVLASLRTSFNLLTDTLDCPENIVRATAVLEKLTVEYITLLDGIIAPGNHGCYVEVMRYLSGKPTRLGYCDFSAMISPAMFERFVCGTLAREGARVHGRLCYHWDGPGQIPHLPLLLALQDLHSIQWVPGAGNPDCLDERWFGLYERIITAGKRICLGGTPADPARIKRLFTKFPKQEFLMPFTLTSRAQAEEILRTRD